MSNAEHLIENVILAMAEKRDPYKELEWRGNQMMLDETGIRKDDLVAMAVHVVYSLYDGVFPDFPD